MTRLKFGLAFASAATLGLAMVPTGADAQVTVARGNALAGGGVSAGNVLPNGAVTA